MIKALADAYRRREAARSPIFGPVHTGSMTDTYIGESLAAALGVVAIVLCLAWAFS